MVCIAWADELVTLGALPSLETLMAELPKDSARTVVDGGAHARGGRAARAIRASRAPRRLARRRKPICRSTSSTSASRRRRVSRHCAACSTSWILRRASSSFATARARSKCAVSSTRLATAAPDATVQIAPARVARNGARRAVRSSRRRARSCARPRARRLAPIALVQPRQLASLRSLAAGGVVKPLTLAEPGMRARDRDARLRARAARRARAGTVRSRADGAGATARRVSTASRSPRPRCNCSSASARQRGAGPRRKPASAAAHATRPAAMARLFITIGSRDNVRPAEISSARSRTRPASRAPKIGKIDVRESHSLVEVAIDRRRHGDRNA